MAQRILLRELLERLYLHAQRVPVGAARALAVLEGFGFSVSGTGSTVYLNPNNLPF